VVAGGFIGNSDGTGSGYDGRGGRHGCGSRGGCEGGDSFSMSHV
jgi:hypothetical protein